MKKLTAVLLIAVCCIILSACNSGENETKITSQVTTSAVTTAKETIQPATTSLQPLRQNKQPAQRQQKRLKKQQICRRK